ncbi:MULTISPECIES: histidinol-phosphate transaminase [unclassified Roseovarius]|uniref:pyridoxal phosphate-dependent aminotransferase n=1 Tax=unclassified Roseovarius TaxID=2614913 RepID=UPI00273E2BB1|nr:MULTISPECIES: histidinol-phosphate transaminase [unclassified Roseovarius]
MIAAKPHVADMAAYALADLTAPPGKRLISLCQNESLRPPSPLAVEASARAARDQQLYPDPDWTDLRHVLSDLHGIDPDALICGNGSLDLIGCLTRAYLGPGDAALAPAHAYPFFRTATLATGARFDTAPEVDLTVDSAALLDAMTPETRIVFVANPGNPTGTRISRADLIGLRAALPEDVILVIDEAYGEFADHLNERCFDLVAQGNTIVLRTLSKAYGLAGARVGWGLFPAPIAAEVRKLLNPNNVSALSQAAAITAVTDQDYMRETCALTVTGSAAFRDGLTSVDLQIPRSFTNFVILRFASSAAVQSADTFLRAEGIFLRPQGGAGLADCLRATIGVADDMAFAAEVLKDWQRKEGPT